MSNSSAMSKDNYHVRSVSMPAKSHPITLRVEEELSKLNTWRTISNSPMTSLKAETIRIGLIGLAGLYNAVEDLLQLPITQQALMHQQQEKWVVEALEGSVRLLDLCGTARDILLQMKEHVRDLQSTLRRRRGGELESKVDAYVCFRKKVQKIITKCFGTLKQIDKKLMSSSLSDEDPHPSMVVRLLTEVRDITVAVFQSLFVFIYTVRPKSKHGRWSLVSKLIHKGQVACEREQEDKGEVESADVALFSFSNHILSKDAMAEREQKVHKVLDALEVSIEGLEAGLDCMFRRLIQTRVSLLNSVTH